MCSLFYHLTFVYHYDVVWVTYGTKTVCHNDDRPVLKKTC
ncbi:hypothetical protein SAMN05660226_00263 [Parapedobacter luteus]|uniref:Uncharacterized protein n=1 Tax=Parapedobacter luteus TaxID=623280 RepID=A0A1T4ZXP0_9SPHI|nr:hypothetical protein SAMN05660226_00263 [Parapedobacter luteus]